MGAKSLGDFSHGSVEKAVTAIAGPMILGQLVGVLYNLVDRIFIGHLPDVGGLALTGLGVVFPLITLMNAFANWVGQGGASLFAIERGRQNTQKAETLLGQATRLLILFSVALMIICFLWMEPILRLFGGTTETLVYALPYSRIYLLGTPFQLLSLGLNPYLSALGRPKTAMGSVMIGAVVNLLLDPVFIYGLRMGVSGAAWATLLSQMTSALWTIYALMPSRSELGIKRDFLRGKGELSQAILSVGFANFIFQLTNAMTQTVSNQILLQYGGALQVGVMTVVLSVRQMTMLPLNAFNQAAKPVISYNYGAQQPHRVVQTIQFMVKVGLIATSLVTVLLLLFPQNLMRLFTNDLQYVEKGTLPLQIYFCSFVMMTFQMVGQATFTALGMAKEATFFSLLRKVFLIIPLTVLLPKIPTLGVLGVYWAEALSEFIGGSACYWTMWKRVGRPLKQGQTDIRAYL